MNYNFHTHTYRCGHARDTEREYIEVAIAGGITEMGFSDHAPWIDPALGTERNYVVPFAMVDDYRETFLALREEYRDKIHLHFGFEAEYDPVFPEEMVKLGAEYLILGQHFFKKPDGGYIYAATGKIDHLLPVYVDAVIAGMKTGAYTYVAHPDVFRFDGTDKAPYEREMTRLCEASLLTGVPLELNFLGIREGRYYPTPLFLEIAGRVGAPVTFGFDAHSAAVAYDGASIPRAHAMVEEYGLNYIGKPKLVLLK
jgi:histidinol-phosphatase (PHP family)